MFNMLSKVVEEASTQIAEEVASGSVEGISFSLDNIGEALLCSGAGMIGIFIVVGVIIGSVSVLNKLGASKK